MKTLEALPFDNRFHRLGKTFYSEVQPQGLTAPFFVSASEAAASLIDLDPQEFRRPEFTALFSGNATLPGFQPLAMVYAGHQFGFYNPQLGDGRALLLGEVPTKSGRRDLVLKGAGPTPYSRRGDGRCVLRSCIREFLCSEAMAGLGIPTTRALCVIGGEDPVFRDRIEKGATLVRLARSHVRFGSFEYFHYTENDAAVKQLADAVIAEHDPSLSEAKDKYLQFFSAVIKRTASMIAHWQAAGFCHGVMNTDNMSIVGETFDYGPFAFLDDYDPTYVCNRSDEKGRYAFGQQPEIGYTNLSALGLALSAFITEAEIREALAAYAPAYTQAYAALMRKKLGLSHAQESDQALCDALLALMDFNGVDYTILFRRLSDYEIDTKAPPVLRALFLDGESFESWLAKYNRRLKAQGLSDAERQAGMKAANPLYILRNHLAQAAIEKAEQEKDFSEVDKLLKLLTRPFDEQPGMAAYAEAPPSWAKSLQLSCSS